MSKISLIAAVDENYGLGKNNQLLCHLPADLKHFKKLTLGKPIIMGHHTYNSIGRPLPDRRNIVLSKQLSIIPGTEVVDSLEKALNLASNAEEIMIIGGARVFEQALPHASVIYLTRIHHQFDADVFFPKLNKENWSCEDAIFYPRDLKNNYDMTFYKFNRN